jgi:hypothetical protein
MRRRFAESLVEQNAWQVQQSEAPLVRRCNILWLLDGNPDNCAPNCDFAA